MAPDGQLRSDRGYVFALGFATTVSMWAVAYLGRLPAVLAPSWLILMVMLLAVAVWAWYAGRRTDHGWRDAMPKLYSFLALARFEKLSLRDREQLFVAMSDGITWDGQAIPGLPPDDAAYLAKLTG